MNLFRAIVTGLVLGIGVVCAATAAPITVTDLAGRTVTVDGPVERLILGEGRFLPALAILDREDPVRYVVGMMGEFEQLDPAGFARWRDRFPRLGEIPRLGRSSEGSFSVEQAIALSPQIAIFGVEGHGPGSRSAETIGRLEAAGVHVVFIDFRRDPLVNVPASIRVMGRLLGRETEAEAFAALYTRELARVTERLASARPTAPTVFLENRVGLSEECCPTMTNGLVGRFVEAAGGRNIASAVVPGAFGTVSIEFLLQSQPDIYVGTGIGQMALADRQPRRIVLGAGATEDAARASLERAIQRRGIAELDAVRSRRAYALWHHFYNSPFNVVAVQAMATWFHPELFRDLDPVATFRSMHERFQPFPLDGVYWIGLP